MRDTQIPTEELAEMFGESEQDIHINARGNAFYCGRCIATSDDNGNPDFAQIKAWCDSQHYWPNVWETNERGNVELYSLDGEALGGLV